MIMYIPDILLNAILVVQSTIINVITLAGFTNRIMNMERKDEYKDRHIIIKTFVYLKNCVYNMFP